jgi:hypothetical protein
MSTDYVVAVAVRLRGAYSNDRLVECENCEIHGRAEENIESKN